MKRLVLCADDFAVHDQASLGIVQLAQRGRLSATSVMVLSARWAQDVALLQDLRARIDVGLHLDWTSDFALAAGHGLSLHAAMLKAVLGGFRRGAALAATRIVIERQLDAFEAHWKAPPDYVDGHQHVQQFSGIREALVQTLSSRYGAGAHMPYVRISRAPAAAADIKSHVIAAMGANALQGLLTAQALPRTTALLGVYDFAGDTQRYARLMQDWLEQAPAHSIIMCHPGQVAVSGDAIGAARAREFDYLGGAAFAAALSAAGVQLVRGAAGAAR